MTTTDFGEHSVSEAKPWCGFREIARGTVSTTLSRLAKAGEITKAARGYQLNHHQPTSPTEDTPADRATLRRAPPNRAS
jgi:hypothetical protein